MGTRSASPAPRPKRPEAAAASGSGGLYHPAGFDAGGANLNPLYLAVSNRPDPLQVGIEPPFVHIVRMADVVPDHGTLSADVAFFGHENHPPSRGKIECFSLSFAALGR
jgi:hypothetical protein